MTTLSIASVRTMTYDAAEAAHAFAIVEKLASLAGVLLRAAHEIGHVIAAPAPRQASA